uniref:Uncharacterized protein n=1 Tax=Solanum lycopersicum TaxID=4081 RepID=K4DCN4_SOLLC
MNRKTTTHNKKEGFKPRSTTTTGAFTGKVTVLTTFVATTATTTTIGVFTTFAAFTLSTFPSKATRLAGPTYNGCSIWVMKRYGDTDSRSKEYNVALGQRNSGMVIAVSDCRKILFTDIKGMLAVYNTEMQTTIRITIAGTMYSFYYENYEETLVLLDKGELLPPVDLASEKSTDDDDDDDDNDDDDHHQILELLKHHVMHKRVTTSLGD